MEHNTIKGHGFAIGDRVDFYGLAKTGALPTAEPTRCKLGKVGNKYMLTSITGELDTWEFGATAKLWAEPVADDSDNVEVKETTLDNGDTVYTATCEHGWATGFYTVPEDATKVARGHGTVSLPMYEAPEVARELPAAPVKAFDESDPATWNDLPAGYVWAEMGGGEFHLFTPDNVNLSEAYYARQAAPVVPVVVDDLVANKDDGYTYVVTRADEYWIGMRKVGEWREGRNIRTEDFRKHMADGALVNVSARLATPEAQAVLVCHHCGRTDTLGRDDQVTPFPHECVTRAELEKFGLIPAPADAPEPVTAYDAVTASDMATAVGVVRRNGRVFTAEAHNFAPDQAFIRAVEAGDLTVIYDLCPDMNRYVLAGHEPVNVVRIAPNIVRVVAPTVEIHTDSEVITEAEVWAGTDTTITPGAKTLMNRRARKSSKRKNTRVNSRRVKGGF